MLLSLGMLSVVSALMIDMLPLLPLLMLIATVQNVQKTERHTIMRPRVIANETVFLIVNINIHNFRIRIVQYCRRPAV